MSTETPVRILVADDNPEVRNYLRGAIERQSWQVCYEAKNGQEVLDHVREGKPDIVILDFLMPVMNGLDAARLLAAISPAVPVLMVTLYLSRQLTAAARAAGVQGACAKTDLGCLVNGVKAILKHETYFPEWSPV